MEHSPSPPSSSNGTLHQRSHHNNNPLHLINNGGLGSPASQHQQQSPSSTSSRTAEEIASALALYDKQFLPGGPKSLSGIATRSFLLGSSLTLSLSLTLFILLSRPESRFQQSSPAIWRAPFFIAILSAFHFLEFWTTARYNTPATSVSSFLLSSNGAAYAIAHTAALLECLLTNYFFPTRSNWLPDPLNNLILLTGLVLVVGGQTIRSIAMISAGTNFNHIVQHRKASSHSLVTDGIYSWFRHPSYFGYFWWGLGTQLVMGNPVCFVGYAAVLWRFFSRRIQGEEELLTRFFGDEYVQYRKRTPVGIPFI